MKIKDVPHPTRKTYIPGAMTPLYDAIANGISSMDAAVGGVEKPSVCITVLTDGLENASREQSFDSVSKLIATKQEDGWTFIFLGAELAAVTMAQGMGVPVGNTSVYNAARPSVAFAAAAMGTRSWVETVVAGDDAYSETVLSDVGADGRIGFEDDEDGVVPE